jgi:N-acetylmuramoyl-L-alanine amidase
MGDASVEIVTALDAGHGGKNSGAVCYRGILREADLNRAVAHAAKQMRPGLALIREDDETLRLRHRNAKAIALLADLVISIHHDSSSKPHRRGLNAFYWRGNGLTRDLARVALDAAPAELAGGRIWDQDYSTGVKAVLGCYRADALLIECAFLSNARDVAYAHTTEGIEDLARVVLAVDDRFRQIMESNRV